MTESNSGPKDETVVVAIDGTEPSMKALRASVRLAAALSAQVVVVFVRHIPAVAGEPIAEQGVAIMLESLDETEETIKTDLEREFQGSGVPYIYVTREGDPAHEIIEAAHEHDAAYVVVGSTIHGAISSILVSSVAEHLLHHCDRSILIVRPDRANA